MNAIDIILSIILLFGLVRGFFKGFLVELAGLVALILGIYGAVHFSGITLNFLEGFLSWEERYLVLLAFALTFFLIVIAIVLLGRILTKLLNLLALGIVNRLAGAFFGLLKMAFFASLFFMFLNQSEIYSIEKESRENSILYSPVEDMAPLILPSILEEIDELNLFDTSAEENNDGL